MKMIGLLNLCRTISVAGFSAEHPNEIVQLALPEKLLPPNKQTLWAKRDFKLINGVITKTPVTDLKYVHQSDLLVSSGHDPTVTIWATDAQQSDLLVKMEEIDLKLSSSLKQAFVSSKDHYTLMDISSASLLLGSSVSLHSLQMVDIESKKTLFDMTTGSSVLQDSELHRIKFVSEDGCVFVSCSGKKGSILVWDRRKPLTDQQQTISSSTNNIPYTSASNYCSSTVYEDYCNFDIAVSQSSYPLLKLTVLGNNGQLVMYDGRKMDKPWAVCHCGNTTSSEVTSGFRGRFSKSVRRQPCIEFCQQTNLLSVSGVTNGVQIYDYSKWSCDMTTPSPLFIHNGHEQESPEAIVLVHSWQPGVEKGTVFSCDDEGSLHAWQWKETVC